MVAPEVPISEVPMLLVRHGQTEWNAARRWQGRRDSPLTALGRTQAEHGAQAVLSAGVSPGSLWASSLGRTVETASIMAEQLRLAPMRLDDRLQETGAGEWEGMLVPDIEARYPGWLDTGRRPDTFESADAVIRRVGAALRDIATHTAAGTARRQPVLVVTHSGVIRRVVAALGGPDARVGNLSGVWVHVQVGGNGSAVGIDQIRLGDDFEPAGVDRRLRAAGQHASE